MPAVNLTAESHPQRPLPSVRLMLTRSRLVRHALNGEGLEFRVLVADLPRFLVPSRRLIGPLWVDAVDKVDD